VLKTVGIVCRVHRAFEAFDDSDWNLARFVELWLSQMWSVLSVVATWHRAWARLTRHSKSLIHLSYMGTESLCILGFVSDCAGLSALWSRGSSPDYSCMRSCVNWCFERWLSHAFLLVHFWLSVQAIRCYNHLARPCDVFHSWGKDVVCTKIFIIWNVYEFIMLPPDWRIGLMSQCSRQ
jgi:hypothetical protein